MLLTTCQGVFCFIVDSKPQVIDFVMNGYPQGVVRVCLQFLMSSYINL